MLKNISRVPATQLLRTERSIKRLRTAKASNGKHKDTRTVVTALIKQAKKLPKELYKSLTWDRGDIELQTVSRVVAPGQEVVPNVT